MARRIGHLIVVALAGTGSFVAASRFAATGSDVEVIDAVRPLEGKPPELTRAAAAPANVPKFDRKRMAADAEHDAFRSATWTPPPPPPAPPAPAVAPPPPPPPTAPPPPFSFVGMMEQKSSRPTAFLARGDALLIAGVGDVIDGTYRVESLSVAGVVVTYLPLNQRQTLGPPGATP